MKGPSNKLYTPFYRVYQTIVAPLNLPFDDSEESDKEIIGVLKKSLETPKISFPIIQDTETKVPTFYEKSMTCCFDFLFRKQKIIVSHLDDKFKSKKLYEQYQKTFGDTFAGLIWGISPIRIEPFNKTFEIIPYKEQQILFDLTVKMAFFRILYDRYEDEAKKNKGQSEELTKRFLADTYQVLHKEIETDLAAVEEAMNTRALDTRLDWVITPMLIAGVFFLFSLVLMYFRLTAEREFNIQDLLFFTVLIPVAAGSGTVLIKFFARLYDSVRRDDINKDYRTLLNAGLSQDFKDEVRELAQVTSSPPEPSKPEMKKLD